MTPFATVEDYETRYGEVEDEARVTALLQDATNIIASQPGFSTCGRDETWWGVLETVTCAMVHRSMMAGSYAGLSNVSQGAGGYTASVSVYNPGGDLYLTLNERRALGLGGGRIGQTDPYACPPPWSDRPC